MSTRALCVNDERSHAGLMTPAAPQNKLPALAAVMDSAYVPYRLNAIKAPAKEDKTAPAPETPNETRIRFEAEALRKLRNRMHAATAKPIRSGMPKTTKSESAQAECDTTRLL
jgi:hypothetical protein